MIKKFDNISQICFSELMRVYEEGNVDNAKIRYSNMDANAAVLQVEQDFYAYLEEVFFAAKDAKYYVLSENEKYLAALRIEPFENGVLLEGLETRPGFRCCGFAKQLVGRMLSEVDCPVYSHVMKDNFPSLRTHYSCGFEKYSDTANMINGSINRDCFTLIRK